MLLVATYRQLDGKVPDFDHVMATPNNLYTFAQTDEGYRVHSVSLKNFRLCQLKLNDEMKQEEQEAVVQIQTAAAFDEHEDGDDKKTKEKEKEAGFKEATTSRKKKKQQQKKKKKGVKRLLEDCKGEATIESMPSVAVAVPSSSTSVASSSSSKKSIISNEPENEDLLEENLANDGPLGKVDLIYAALLLPPTEKAVQVLLLSIEGFYRCTLSPSIKLELLFNRDQIIEAFREGADEVFIYFTKCIAFDQATSTVYIKAAIQRITEDRTGSGRQERTVFDHLITYQLDTELDKSGGSPVGRLGILELLYEGAKGADYDPETLLQQVKCIALWKRKLFMLLETKIEDERSENDGEPQIDDGETQIENEGSENDGEPAFRNSLYTCAKMVSSGGGCHLLQNTFTLITLQLQMIIHLDEGNRWEVVDTADLPINESCPPMSAHKFKWVKRGPESQQLLGVLTCFEEYKEKDDGELLIKRKNFVNSVWSFDMETLQWSCLNTGKKAVRQRARDNTIEDGGEMKKVKTPSIEEMIIAANADGLWILPRIKDVVPLDHSATTEFFYVPLDHSATTEFFYVPLN